MSPHLLPSTVFAPSLASTLFNSRMLSTSLQPVLASSWFIQKAVVRPRASWMDLAWTKP